ncbi:19726_t:CDS:1, partial [Gigaspora margarita]
FLTQPNQTIQLNIQKEIKFSSGYKAHEMPETTLLWIEKFKYAQENIAELFEEELEKADLYLNQEEYQSFYSLLELGLKKASEGFYKWMNRWIHLPYVVCLLGSLNGPQFASAFLKVFFNTSSYKSISDIEKKYIDILENDKNNGISNTLGLLEALENLDFKEEFTNYAFTNSSEKSLEQFPLIYNFVKFRIWSILIRQQQLEGMFNRYDIKVHPNM